MTIEDLGLPNKNLLVLLSTRTLPRSTNANLYEERGMEVKQKIFFCYVLPAALWTFLVFPPI